MASFFEGLGIDGCFGQQLNCIGVEDERAPPPPPQFDGDTPFNPVPRLINGFGNAKVVLVSAGEAHSLAVTDDGGLHAWGSARCSSNLATFKAVLYKPPHYSSVSPCHEPRDPETQCHPFLTP